MIVLALLPLLAAAESAGDERTDRRNQVIEMLRASQRQHAAGHYDSVLTTLAALREIDPANQDAYYYSAVAHLSLGDTALAVQVLDEGAERAPLSSRIKFLRVRLHLIAGETDAARELLNAVKMFKPNNPEAMYLEGRLALAEGDTNAALELWEAALERVQKRRRGRSVR